MRKAPMHYVPSIRNRSNYTKPSNEWCPFSVEWMLWIYNEEISPNTEQKQRESTKWRARNSRFIFHNLHGVILFPIEQAKSSRMFHFIGKRASRLYILKKINNNNNNNNKGPTQIFQATIQLFHHHNTHHTQPTHIIWNDKIIRRTINYGNVHTSLLYLFSYMN